MLDKSFIKYDFQLNGFIILKNILSKKLTNKCKIQLFKSYSKFLNCKIDEKNIHKEITFHENNKRWDILYEAYKEVRNSSAFQKISQQLEKISLKFFDVKTKIISTGYAIGVKNSSRTSYNWHQEKSYYKKIDTFHFQFPFLNACTKKNGTMSVLQGSHTLGVVNNTNYKRLHKKSIYSHIPKEISKMKKFYNEKYLVMEIGDVCVFNQNIVHRSNKNLTNKIRFAGISRQKII